MHNYKDPNNSVVSMVHRDLKPENILLTSKESQRYEIKVTDFGFSCFFDPSKGKGLEISLGSAMYMSPELIERKSYDQSVDIWSIGIITYMLLSGRAPFSGKSKEDLQNAIRNKNIDLNKPYFEKISPEAKDFILRCCIKKVSERASAQELLKHPWLVNTLDVDDPQNTVSVTVDDQREMIENLKKFATSTKF